MLHEELDTRFSYHRPSSDQIEKYASIRTKARSMAEMMNQLCPESRELSLAMTNMEQAVMWANAAIARRTGSDE